MDNSIFNHTVTLSVLFAVLAGALVGMGIAIVLQLEAVPAMLAILCGAVGTGTLTAIGLVLFYKDETA